MARSTLSNNSFFNALKLRVTIDVVYSSTKTLATSAGEVSDPPYMDVPKPHRRKSERKPYLTPMKVLIGRAKEEREARKTQPCRMLEEPPDNGLLVPELVEVAHRVYRARERLLLGVSKLIEVIPVQRCRCCSEVHIGHTGHEIRTCSGPKSGLRSATHVWEKGGVQDVIYFPKSFHLYDRVGKSRVGHDERRTVRKIPGLVELCVQAGLDLKKYPTKRRTRPVYCIEGRIVDFEAQMEKDEKSRNSNVDCKPIPQSNSRIEPVMGISTNLDKHDNLNMQEIPDERNSLGKMSSLTLESWFEMISGAKKIMEKYRVWTCGYCPEVQVGPKGHKVRMCKAAKHQSRNGLHAWQEATIDDLVAPKYVWHLRDLQGPPLVNNLKRYYGKAPAVVELCVQADAAIPDEYRSMMRLDVVPPDRDEVDLVT